MRLELYYKTQSELTLKLNQVYLPSILPVNSNHTINSVKPCETMGATMSFNIPNKIKSDNLIQPIKIIHNVYPTANICVHYATKHHNVKTIEDSANHFIKFCQEVNQADGNEVLLISGGGIKKPFNSMSCLQYLDNHKVYKQQLMSMKKLMISVAFNPYFPNKEQQDLEFERLINKLETGLVSKIYFQFGSDVSLLQNSINKLIAYLKDFSIRYPSHDNIQLIGSIFIPSKQFLARMKFRPWFELFLSDSFLNDINVANGIVNQILHIYKSHDIEILIENNIKNYEEYQNIQKRIEMIRLPDAEVLTLTLTLQNKKRKFDLKI